MPAKRLGRVKHVKIIREDTAVGIGSTLFRGLHRLYYRIPDEVLHFHFTNPLYGDGRENVWDRYLRQPFAADAELIAGEIRAGRAQEEHGVFNRPEQAFFFGYGAGHDPNTFRDPPRVTALREFARPFLQFHDFLWAKAGRFAAENFSGKRTLSLQKRGTDHFAAQGHAREQRHLMADEYVRDTVRRAMERHACEQLFLATDEQAFADYLEKALGVPVLSYATLRARKHDQRGIHNPRFGRWRSTKHLLGEEAIIDSMLMSRCEHSLCMRSNLSLLAILLRDDFAYAFIDDHVDYR